MKATKLAVALGFTMVMISGAVNAADQGSGTVTFNGEIIDAPCSVAPESVDQVVEMGQISNRVLLDQGKSSTKPFNIELQDCDITTQKSVNITFGGSADINNPDLLGIAGSASGAGIGIVTGSGEQVQLGQAADTTTLLEGDNTLEFAAYLQGSSASQAVVPGEFTSVANFTLAYE